jgi:hypothetical protein
MYDGYLAAAVNALEQEIKYYRRENEEQKKVIEQLHRGYALPGEVTYIHPYDMCEILNNLAPKDVILFNANNYERDIIDVKGVRYKQTPYMPCITKNIK